MSIKKKNIKAKRTTQSKSIGSATAKGFAAWWPIALFVGMLVVIPIAYSMRSIEPVVPIRHGLLAFFPMILLLPLFLKSFTNFSIQFPKGNELFNLLLISGGICLVWKLICSTQAANEEEALYVVNRYIVTIIVMFLAVLAYLINQKGFLMLFKLLALIGGYHAIVGIGQLLGISTFIQIPGVGVPYGYMANSNLYGSGMAILFPFGLYLLITQKNIWRWIGLLSAVLCIIAIFISKARASYLATFAVLGTIQVLFFLNRNGFTAEFRKFWWRLSLAALIAIPVAISAFSLIDGGKSVKAVAGRIAQLADLTEDATENNKAGSANQRLATWYISTGMIKEYPILGVGPGNWRVNSPRYGIGDLNKDGAKTFVRAHNDYVQIAAETGIIGLAMYLSFWGVILFMGWRAIKQTKDANLKILLMVLIGATIGQMVDMMFSFPHERLEHTLYRAFIWGGIVALYLGTSNSLSKVKLSAVLDKKAVRFGVMPAMILILAFNCLIANEMFKFQEHMKLANNYKKQEQFKKVVEEVDKGKSSLVTLGPIIDPIELYEAIGYKGLKQYDKAMEAALIAQENHPYSARVYNTVGTIYTETSRFEEAIKFYEDALAVIPEYSVVMMNLGINYYNVQRYTEAADILGKVNLDNNANLKQIYEYSKAMAAQTQ